ncbi:uncharacterized protein LOC135492882 [Lineus longissimus]|uniref:uncharacterized protein LOC135492882 n=1 Tax=Lineus longissimus TaxID=88925 RepID=UPI00315D9A7F
MVGTPNRASVRSPCIICPPDPSGHGHSHGSSNISVISTVTQSSGSKATLTKSQKSQYYYVEDYFDKSPKTDYTYVRSGSYSKEHLEDDYIIPNLSRPGLRSSASFLSIDNDMSRTNSTDGSYLMSTSMSRTINSRVTRSGSKSKGVSLLSGVTGSMMKGRRRKKDTTRSTVRVLEYDEGDEDISTISAASQSQNQHTMASQSQMSNQTTYSTSNRSHSNNISNRSSRTSINHLYGLDHTDTELSDNESNYTQTNTASAISASHSSLASIASYVQSSSLYILIRSFIYTHIITTIAGFFSQCWWLIGAWFYGLISKVAVFDVWILSRTTHHRRRWGILLLLLLLLLGLLSAYRNNALYLPYLFGGRDKTIVVQQEGGNVISGVALEEKVRQIIGDLNIYQNLRQEINQVILQQQKSPEQVAAGLSRKEVELIARGILTERLVAYEAMSEQQRKADGDAQGLKDKERSEEMRGIQAQLHAMQQKTKVLEKEIHVALARTKLNSQEASATGDKKQDAAYIADLQNQIRGLRDAFARIEQTQLAFASQLKNCCQNATELGLLINEKVAAALTMLMSTDTNGGSSRSIRVAGRVGRLWFLSLRGLVSVDCALRETRHGASLS